MIVTGNPISCATTVCILSLLLCLASCASGEYESRELSNGGSNDGRTPGNNFASCSEGKCIKRTQEIANGMWFGPRLGKRHRSDDQKQDANPDILALMNALDSGRFAVITIPGSEKRQPSMFTPRLGRESDEDIFPYEDVLDRNEFNEDNHLAPPIFTPRPGRGSAAPRLLWKSSPRLGRELRSVLRKI